MDVARITRRPSAQALPVEDVLELVQSGKVRIPHFQRPLRWRSSHVVDLFDSIYAGLPIGVLLFSKEPRRAEIVRLGSLSLAAPDAPDAFVVIDGQQRITALAASLLHPEPSPRGDVFAIWFDLEAEKFHRLEQSEPPPSWIPLNAIGDSYRTLEWLDVWPYRSERPDLAKRALALAKAIREYHVPAYIVEGASESVLRVIFKRINTSGLPMKESEVFQALYGSEERSVQGACDRLAATGFGQLNPEWFLRCLKAIEGIDPRAKLQERAEDVDDQSIERTEQALRSVLEFLMVDVGIHHGQFLPYRLPIVILARYFHLHPNPVPRNRLLLRWWVWRGALTGVHTDSSNANMLAHQQAIDEDEAGSVSRLLGRVPESWNYPNLLRRWYGQSAATRLSALAMLSLAPVNPLTGAAWSLEDIRGRLGNSHSLGDIFIDVSERKKETIAGRLLVGDRAGLSRLLEAELGVLETHGISLKALQAFEEGDFQGFERERADCLAGPFRDFFDERSGAGENSRPSIRSILQTVA
jgi:hypothetical protein